jgi:hypothetical protein
VIGIYALWPIIFPPKSNVVIKAFNQYNEALVANVTVSKGGVTVYTGSTPLNLTLEYGTYTFVCSFEDLKIEKTIEISQKQIELVFSFEVKPKISKVTVRAFDQENKELIAKVEIYRDGDIVNIGTTPWNLVLYYGTYNFRFNYENQTIEKTVEITQESQEIIVQFKIEYPPVFLEITTDELIMKIATFLQGKGWVDMEELKSNENVTELENWLRSLLNKTIRITGKVASIYEWTEEDVDISFEKTIGPWTPHIIVKGKGARSLIVDKLGIKQGDLITIDAKLVEVEGLTKESPDVALMEFVRFIKKY